MRPVVVGYSDQARIAMRVVKFCLVWASGLEPKEYERTKQTNKQRKERIEQENQKEYETLLKQTYSLKL